jgi:hypothetical protein
MTKRKKTKGQTMIYKTLYRILKIEQREHHLKPRESTGARKSKQFLLCVNILWNILDITILNFVLLAHPC